MAQIAPFRGIRFAPTAGDLAGIVAPPYDVISEGDRVALEAVSPYNVVRLILPRDEQAPQDEATGTKYTRAAQTLSAWQDAGVLVGDQREVLYLYEQRFTLDGRARRQSGILAAVQLDDPGAGGVLPHERTYEGIVDDRLQLLRATATNLDCIFCVYQQRDPSAARALEAAAATPPLSAFVTPDGIEHVLWEIADADSIRTIVVSLESATVVIADGHHRWQTALHYRQERRDAGGAGPWDAQMMFLVDAGADGPALLPIHRVVHGLTAERALAAMGSTVRATDAGSLGADDLARALAARRSGGRVFAMFNRDAAWWLTVEDVGAEQAALPSDRSDAWRDLDVSVLHHLVFDQLLGGVEPAFVHRPREVAEIVNTQPDAMGFLLAPMSFDSVVAVAQAGDAMPQKSTYFVPKPITGLVMRSLNEP